MAEAVVVLFVSFGLVVLRVEPAEAVEDGTARLSEVVGEGEAKGEPVFVSVGDVDSGILDAAGDDFNVVSAFLALSCWL